MSNWISVNDRLPETDLFVDVWCGSAVSKEYGRRYTEVLFMNGRFDESKLGCPSVEVITHWQPLPKSPGDA